MAKVKEKDIAIIKLKIHQTILDDIFKDSTDDFEIIIYNYLRKRYGREPKEDDDVQTWAIFDELQTTTKGSTTFYHVKCDIKKRKFLVSNHEDETNGEIIFVYWGTNSKDITIFCFVRSALTGAWSMLKEKNYSFPSLFAKHFLDPSRVSTIKLFTLLGADTGSQTKIFTKDEEDIFQPSIVMERCAVVEELKAYFTETKHSTELTDTIKFINAKEKIVSMQRGQIKLPLKHTGKSFDPSPYFKMLKFIEDSIKENLPTIEDDEKWRFMDVCQQVESDKKQTDKKLKQAFVEFYEDSAKGHSIIDPSSRLYHKYQEFFNAAFIGLSYKDNEIEWGPDEKERQGESITIRCLRAALKRAEVSISNDKDVDQICLTFRDTIYEKDESYNLIEMMRCVDRVLSGDEKFTVVKFGKRNYRLCAESFYEVFYQFINAVQQSLPKKFENPPKILPWNNSKEKTPCFSIQELYDFCRVDSKPDLTKLSEILCKDTVLFDANGINNILDGEGANDEDSSSSYESSTSTENKESLDSSHSYESSTEIKTEEKPDPSDSYQGNHSLELLALNKSLINKSDLAELKPKSDKTQAANENEETVRRKHIEGSGCSEETKSQETKYPTTEEHKPDPLLWLPTCHRQDKTIRDSLTQTRKIVQKIEGKDGMYKVETPHLTKDIWRKISTIYPEICPVRLVQFLRMNSVLLEEGDYNELYHLSNCCCRTEGWKYLVGDRITPSSIHGIEFCDVLASKGNTFYYLHVKHKFDGNAARALCSQVRASIKCLWESLVSPSKENMVEKFYDAVSGYSKLELEDHSKDSLHKKLTFSELKNIGSTKEHFLQTLLGNDTNHYVCLSPSIGSDCSFEAMRGCNLSYRFTKDDFKSRENPFKYLIKAGILNENGRVMPQFFNITNPQDFTARVKKNLSTEEKEQLNQSLGNIRDTIKGKLHIKGSLLSTGSFVAKNEFVQLHSHFAKICRVHGSQDPIKLRILEVEVGKTVDTKKDGSGQKKVATKKKDASAKKRIGRRDTKATDPKRAKKTLS
eukprot:TCONS_00047009-protein